MAVSTDKYAVRLSGVALCSVATLAGGAAHASMDARADVQTVLLPPSHGVVCNAPELASWEYSAEAVDLVTPRQRGAVSEAAPRAWRTFAASRMQVTSVRDGYEGEPQLVLLVESPLPDDAAIAARREFEDWWMEHDLDLSGLAFNVVPLGGV